MQYQLFTRGIYEVLNTKVLDNLNNHFKSFTLNADFIKARIHMNAADTVLHNLLIDLIDNARDIDLEQLLNKIGWPVNDEQTWQINIVQMTGTPPPIMSHHACFTTTDINSLYLDLYKTPTKINNAMYSTIKTALFSDNQDPTYIKNKIKEEMRTELFYKGIGSNA